MFQQNFNLNELGTIDKTNPLANTVPPLPDPNVGAAVSAINARAPWLSPETQLSLARANASPQAVDAVADMAGRRYIDYNQAERERVGQTNIVVRRTLDTLGWVKRLTGNIYETLVPGFGQRVFGDIIDGGQYLAGGVSSVVKPVARYTFAGLDAFPETAQNAAAFVMGKSSGDLRGFWDSLSIATLLDDRKNAGDGYFISNKLRQEQARRARDFRGTIYGSAFTIGRGTAGMILRENTLAYRLTSGIIDAGVALWADPSKVLGKTIAKGAKAAKAIARGEPIIEELMPLLSAQDIGQQRAFEQVLRRGARMSQEDKDKLIAEVGGSFDISGPNVNYTKWRNFMETNPVATKLVSQLVSSDDPLDILENTFKYDISTDTAIKLSQAKSKDAVIRALEDAATLGRGAIDQSIGRYRRIDSPLLNGIRKSRWFTNMPKGSIVVSGDRFDNVEAIKTMVNGMRIAGVSDSNVTKWANITIRSFSEGFGTPTAKKAAVDAYYAFIDNVLEANGLVKEVRKSILSRGNAELDAFRTYMFDRAGRETDNGLVQALFEQLKPYMDKETMAKYAEDMVNVQKAGDIHITKPMEFAHMLDRIQVLPDIRDIRRVTRNPFLTKWKITQSTEMAKTRLPGWSANYIETPMQIIGKRAITARRKLQKVTKIKDLERHQELTGLIDDLERRYAGKINDDVRATIDNMKDERDSLQVLENAWALTPEKRYALAAVEWMQNSIWKPLNLATIGYIMRNGMDAQVRMAFAGLDSAPKHPFEYIMLLTGRKYRRGLQGQNIVGEGWSTSTWEDDIRESLAESMAAPGLDGIDIYNQKKATGSFPMVSRASAPGRNTSKWHTTAIVHEGQRFQRKDPASIQMLRLQLANVSKAEAVETIVGHIMNPFTNEHKKLRDLYAEGITYINDATGEAAGFEPVLFDKLRKSKEGRETLKNILSDHVNRVIHNNANTWTGNVRDIQFMYAYNAIGDYDNLVTKAADEFTGLENARGVATAKGELHLGGTASTMVNGQKVEGAVVAMQGDQVTLVPFKYKDVLVNKDYRDGTKQARRLIERTPIWDGTPGGKGLPMKVPYEQRMGRSDKKSMQLMDSATNWFFNRLYENVSRKLEKSPVFRQFYYRVVDENIDMLSSQEARKFLDEMMVKAKADGFSADLDGVKKYLGVSDTVFDSFKFKFKKPENVVDRIEAIASSTTHRGTATVEELDDFAKWNAIHDTKNLLYDASVVTSIEDTLKIIAPFITAWREILSTYAHFAVTDNIRTVRAFQRVYTGLEEADPDQDGRGFFYRDPQTNDVMFTFPMSGYLAKALTGIYAPLEAPVSRLSQGISILPAVGPYGQLAASVLIPDTPKYDKINEFIMPYGTRSLVETVNPLPGWSKKLAEVLPVWGQKTNKMDTVYANTYIEVLRALSVNPKYDLSTEDGLVQLQADAKERASILAGMRALSQFMGPTAGTQDFRIPTNKGDQYVSELVRELEKFRADDYDSAIDKFLDLYGDDTVLYIASKTRSLRDGLETTEEFGAWERNNRDLINAFPRTAVFLAPKGSEFNFSVWQRQMEEGSRERLTDVELVKMAQERLGKTKYRAAQKMFGPYRTEQQAAVLAAYREYLHEQLPGFPLRTEYKVNVFENDMEELRSLVEDKRAIENLDPTTRAMVPVIQRYIAMRDQAIAAAGGKSLKSKGATRYRQQLFSIGEGFAEQEPAFARIWQRLLSQEVED